MGKRIIINPIIENIVRFHFIELINKIDNDIVYDIYIKYASDLNGSDISVLCIIKKIEQNNTIENNKVV